MMQTRHGAVDARGMADCRLKMVRVEAGWHLSDYERDTVCVCATLDVREGDAMPSRTE